MTFRRIVKLRSRAAHGAIPCLGTGFYVWLMLVHHALAGPRPVQYETVKGKVRIEGTSNIDDWQVETKTVDGHFNVDPGFPRALAEGNPGGGVLPQARFFVEVASLKSVEKDGKPFSNLMDEILHAKLKVSENPRIGYRLSGLTLTAKPRSQEEPYRFEAKGELAVAGVTNHVNLPINVMPLDGDRLRIWGSTALRMTDFKIDPPAPKIALGIVKTADEVKISFEWVVAGSGRPHSAAAAETLPR